MSMRTLPAARYVESRWLERERAAVFASAWHLIAHESQLADAGDHVVGEAAGVPLLAVKGADEVIRVLHNVCRHRAGPLSTVDGRGAKLHARRPSVSRHRDGARCGIRSRKGLLA
jgi:choline monooxygenase